MRLIQLFLLLTIFALTPACSSPGSGAATMERMPPVAEGEGRLVFYRPSSMAAALKPSIRVNDESVGTARSKTFLFINRPPGTYVVACSTLLEHSRSYNLSAGQTIYVKLTSTVGLVAGHVIPSLANESTAQSSIKNLKYIGDPTLLTAAQE